MNNNANVERVEELVNEIKGYDQAIQDAVDAKASAEYELRELLFEASEKK